jgi:hypothetical protein
MDFGDIENGLFLLSAQSMGDFSKGLYQASWGNSLRRPYERGML